MNDQEFLTAFEQGALDHFPHQAHLRMAWLYLRRDGWQTGLGNIRGGIQRFAALNGAEGKYHETITQFWARVVYHLIQQSPEIADFHAFLTTHPQLLDGKLIERHYTRALLFSDAARQVWAAPDVLPMPELVEGYSRSSR